MRTQLECSNCRKTCDPLARIGVCPACGKPLLVRYDLDRLLGCFLPHEVGQRALRSMWRFWEVLPVHDPDHIVTLGEGGTPLLKLLRRGPFQPYPRLYLKDESFNPTGTFKARGLSAAVSMARELGVKAVALPSAGNAGGAAAAYCARAGIACHLFMPKDTPRANIAEAVIYGARVTLVDGLINDCGRLVRAGQQQHGWFDLSTLKEPYRLEGKKTMGYELALDFGLELPDVILYPTGGGTGLIGMWKAFEEMERLAWIGPRRPKMVVVQSSGCAPIVRAWREGRREAPFWEHAETIASGLRVPAAIGDFLMLDIVRQSQGWGVEVTDEAILQAQSELAREQGLYICPEGAACWAALKRLVAEGKLGGEERLLLFNTGAGLKYTDLVPLDLPVFPPPPP